MEKSEEEDSDFKEDGINIATIGSKNRVCLPPDTCNHLKAGQGDHLVFVLKHTVKDKKPYIAMLSVKPENFDVGETAETLVDVLKKK